MSNKTTINNKEYPTLKAGCSACLGLKYDTIKKKLKKEGNKIKIVVKVEYEIEAHKCECIDQQKKNGLME